MDNGSSGRLVNHEESEASLTSALNYSQSLTDLGRYQEPKSLLRTKLPVARRVYGESHDLTLRMRSLYARALCEDAGATLDDLREAVTSLEDSGRTARRVFGGAHPLTTAIGIFLRKARAARDARETPPRRA